MIKKNSIATVTLALVAGCGNQPVMSDDELRECPPGQPRPSVLVDLRKNGPGKWGKPEADPEVVCVYPGGKVMFLVDGADPGDSVATLPNNFQEDWLFKTKPPNAAVFTVEVPDDQAEDDYKYWVYWTGKSVLDPIVGVRGRGNSRLLPPSNPQTPPAGNPPASSANESPPR